jgi:hypothetical protein
MIGIDHFRALLAKFTAIIPANPKNRNNILKNRKKLKKTLAFFVNLWYHVLAPENRGKLCIYHGDRRCSEWLSVIIVARA